MRIRSFLMPAVALGVAVLVLMGAQSCGKAVVAAGAGPGGSTVITYQGLGNPPAKGHVGEWLRTGNSNWAWATAGGAAGAALGAWAAASTPRKNASQQYAYAKQNYGVGDPCYNKSNQLYRPPNFVVTIFSGTRRAGNSLKPPFLDCQGLYKAIDEHGLPARLKSISDCILLMLRGGEAVISEGVAHYHMGGGVVGINRETGRVVGARPAQGSWTKCARMTR